MSCCTNTLDLGCFDSCSTIELPFNYAVDGAHIFYFKSQFGIKKTITGVEDEPIQIDLSILLEEAEYLLYITDPEGERVTLTVEDAVYDCFIIKTEFSKSV